MTLGRQVLATATTPSTADVALYFEDLYGALGGSETYRRLGREVYGEGLGGQLGLITAAELERVAEVLALRPGDRVLDLCAGPGIAGAMLARITGARVLGADCALPRRPTVLPFVRCDGDALPLATASFAGLVCIDGFSYQAPRFLGECARVLSAGGRFAFLLSLAVDEVERFQNALAGSGMAGAAGQDVTETAIAALTRLSRAYARHRRALEAEIGPRRLRGLTDEVAFLREEMRTGRIQRRLVFGER